MPVTPDDFTMWTEHEAGATWRDIGAMRGISHVRARARAIRAAEQSVLSYPAKEPPAEETGAAGNPGTEQPGPTGPPSWVTGPGEPEPTPFEDADAELPAAIERRPAPERTTPGTGYRFAFSAARLDARHKGDWILPGTATPTLAVKLQATEGRTPEEAAAFQAKADELGTRPITFVSLPALVWSIRDAASFQDKPKNDWRPGATSTIVIPLRGTFTPEEESASVARNFELAKFHLAEFVKRGWAAQPDFKHKRDLAVFYAVLWGDWSADQLMKEACAVRWHARRRGIYPGQEKPDTRDHRVQMDEWTLAED